MFAKNRLAYKAIDLPDRREFSPAQMLENAQAFYRLMATRHTVRDFSGEPIDPAIIQACVHAAGTAPSGANHQPWHFVAVRQSAIKREIRLAAEKEERRFYAGGAGDEWLQALEPMGTNSQKPHLERAPWLIVVFAQRWGEFDDGTRYKNYYVPESVGIATGLLLTAIHHAGLVALTHTPNPMRFLNGLLGRPSSEKPVMIIAVGKPDVHAKIPAAAKIKKPLEEILTLLS